MSSQDNAGIPLAHAPDGVGYKLLELPQELVDLLEGENPPAFTLTPTAGAALLKTADKTYSLRQKNTSNALIILAPRDTSVQQTQPRTKEGEGGEGVEDTFGSPEPTQTITRPGLHAISTIHETVELVPETGDAAVPAAKARGKWHEKFGRSR